MLPQAYTRRTGPAPPGGGTFFRGRRARSIRVLSAVPRRAGEFPCDHPVFRETGLVRRGRRPMSAHPAARPARSRVYSRRCPRTSRAPTVPVPRGLGERMPCRRAHGTPPSPLAACQPPSCPCFGRLRGISQWRPLGTAVVRRGPAARFLCSAAVSCRSERKTHHCRSQHAALQPSRRRKPAPRRSRPAAGHSLRRSLPPARGPARRADRIAAAARASARTATPSLTRAPSHRRPPRPSLRRGVPR